MCFPLAGLALGSAAASYPLSPLSPLQCYSEEILLTVTGLLRRFAAGLIQSRNPPSPRDEPYMLITPIDRRREA